MSRSTGPGEDFRPKVSSVAGDHQSPQQIRLSLFRLGPPSLVDPLLARIPATLLRNRKEFVEFGSFVKEAGTSDLGLVLFAVKEATGYAERSIRRLSREALGQMVVLARFTPLEVSLLSGVLAKGRPRVLWNVDSDPHVRQVLLEASNSNPARVLGDSLKARSGVSPVVRTAVRLVCSCESSCRTVRELSDRMGVAESTLRYHWSAAFDRVSLKELMDWTTLLRVVRLRKNSGLTRAASLVGCHRRTLERVARRVAGMSLADAASRETDLFGKFAKWSHAAFSSKNHLDLPRDSGSSTGSSCHCDSPAEG